MVDSDESVTEETTDVEGQEPDDNDDGDWDKARAQAKIKKANSEAAGLRKRLKELEEKNSKYSEYEAKIKAEEEAKKSTEERFADLSSTNKELARKVALYEVASQTGLTPAQAARLRGDTPEELLADAEQLKKDLGLADGENEDNDDELAEWLSGNRRTVADVSRTRAPGSRGNNPANFDPDKIASDIRSNPWR